MGIRGVFDPSIRPLRFLPRRLVFGVRIQRFDGWAAVEIHKKRSVKLDPRLVVGEIQPAAAEMAALQHIQQRVVHMHGQFLLDRPAVDVFVARIDDPDAHPVPGHAVNKMVGHKRRVIVLGVNRAVGEKKSRVADGLDGRRQGKRFLTGIVHNVMREQRRAGRAAKNKARLADPSRRHARAVTVTTERIKAARAARQNVMNFGDKRQQRGRPAGQHGLREIGRVPSQSDGLHVRAERLVPGTGGRHACGNDLRPAVQIEIHGLAGFGHLIVMPVFDRNDGRPFFGESERDRAIVHDNLGGIFPRGDRRRIGKRRARRGQAKTKRKNKKKNKNRDDRSRKTFITFQPPSGGRTLRSVVFNRPKIGDLMTVESVGGGFSARNQDSAEHLPTSHWR